MDVKKYQRVPPLTFFGSDTVQKSHFKKNWEIFSSQRVPLFTILSLRYGADFGRSRLVFCSIEKMRATFNYSKRYGVQLFLLQHLDSYSMKFYTLNKLNVAILNGLHGNIGRELSMKTRIKAVHLLQTHFT